MKKLLYSLSMGICASLNTLSMVFRAKDKKPDGDLYIISDNSDNFQYVVKRRSLFEKVGY